ncbi:MAG: hypothetical protein ACR2OZ_19965 [Verrucomicrobiales bacterium]
MDPEPENYLARFKAFWLTMGLILLFALLGLFVRRFQAPKPEEINSELESKRLATLQEVRDAQAKAIESMGLVYHHPEGGHISQVSIPDPLLAKAVARLRQTRGHRTEQVVPGSKTQLEQSKQHDPVESEFLKK